MATSELYRAIQTLRGSTLPHEGAGLTDGQLLECYVVSREESAFAALVRRHGPMVWGVCRRVLRSHQDAEDAFQATFLVLVRKAASVVPRELVANWLYGVAHQTALKARATGARRRTREKQVKAMPEPALERQEIWDDLQAVLDQELSRLPDKYRAVIVLCDLQGKTRKEAARHFRLPEGTVATRLATARAMLARRLARYGRAVPGAALAAVLAQNVASAGLPASVASSTIKAASLFAAGQATAAGAVSVRAVALAEGVLKTMLLTKLKIATALLVAVAFLGAAAAALTPREQAAKPAAPPVQEQPAQAVKPPAPAPAVNKEAETLPTLVRGVVKAVNAEKRTLTVAHREGETTFTVAKDARIDIDNRPGTLAGLPRGADVTLSRFVDARTAGNVEAGGRWYFGAPLKAVDAARNTITLADRDGDKTFGVAPDACITVDGKHCKLAAVPPGAFVNVGLAADQTTARSIGADGPHLGACGGSMVKAVDPVNHTITFDDKAVAEVAGKTFTVARDAVINLDGRPGKLAEVPTGAYVNVILTVDRQTARQLNVQGPPFLGDCGGSLVKAVDVEKRTITFDDKARAEVAGRTFTVAQNAVIHIDGKRAKLTDLPAGAYVNLRLALDGQTARDVNAQGPAAPCDCDGSMVKAVDVEKRTITFADTARAEVAGKTYPVAKDALITIDGKPGKLTELPTGAYVNLRLAVDQQTARHVNAQGPAASGVVKAVDAAKNTVTVGDATYTVAKDAVIVIDGQRGQLAGLPTGASVSLRLHVDQRTVGMIHAKAP
jgi:RNA polymerase sigma factor (sigma-70 family)